jgi:AraC-like DNA-binding protein
MSTLPYSMFATGNLAEKDRFAAWREDISDIFEVERVPKIDLEPFHAEFHIYNFGRSVLAGLSASPGRYVRSTRQRARDGFDAILLQLFLEGGVQFGVEQRVTYGDAGDIVVFDLAQPVDNINRRFRHITSMWARSAIESLVPQIASWHGRTLPRDNPSVALLRQHMMSSYELAARFSPAEGRRVEEATLCLACASMTGGALAEESGRTPALDEVLIYQIKRHIRKNLGATEEGADQIARRFGISRRRLYQLLEPIGGIAAYRRNLRLQRCCDALQDPARAHLQIAEIAYQWGFTHPASFSRSFRESFGMTPREARVRQRQTGGGPHLVPASKNLKRQLEHREWFRVLGT